MENNIIVFALTAPYASKFAGFLVYNEQGAQNNDWYFTPNPDCATKFNSKDEAMKAVNSWPNSCNYDFMYFERI